MGVLRVLAMGEKEFMKRVKKENFKCIDCYVRGETNKAYYLEFGVGKKKWLPKAHVTVGRGGGKLGACDVVVIPEWLARDRKIG
jgi:hypothetical protein